MTVTERAGHAPTRCKLAGSHCRGTVRLAPLLARVAFTARSLLDHGDEVRRDERHYGDRRSSPHLTASARETGPIPPLATAPPDPSTSWRLRLPKPKGCHMWTAPIGKRFFRMCDLAAFGHMSGLSVRTCGPLALMKSDGRGPRSRMRARWPMTARGMSFAFGLCRVVHHVVALAKLDCGSLLFVLLRLVPPWRAKRGRTYGCGTPLRSS